MAEQLFESLFPHARISRDSAAAHRFNLMAGGAYYAVGAGGPITGRGARGPLIARRRQDALFRAPLIPKRGQDAISCSAC
jgi:hypothetical protein